MSTKEKERPKWDSYEDYLKSDHWQNIKNEVYATRGRTCMLCYEWENTELHHIRYPKDWNDDESGNVIILCKNHHKQVHTNNLTPYEIIKLIIHRRIDLCNNCCDFNLLDYLEKEKLKDDLKEFQDFKEKYLMCKKDSNTNG